MNWTALTSADLQKVGPPAVIAAAEAQSPTATAEAIADAVSAVRGACSTGNSLDIDTTKVPNSLKALTARMALWALYDILQLELTQDQRDSRKADQSRINRITDLRLRFETPDNAGVGEMQQAGGIETITSSNRQQYTREGLNGL